MPQSPVFAPEEAVRRLNAVLAHAWMVRTFLKHADEIQESEEMLDVPRTLYDGIRATEPAFQRRDWAEFLRRLKGKLPKLRRAADSFAANFRRFSPHTNFEMASASLLGVVERIEEILAAVDWDAVRALPRPDGPAGAAADPLDEIEIPEV